MQNIATNIVFSEIFFVIYEIFQTSLNLYVTFLFQLILLIVYKKYL